MKKTVRDEYGDEVVVKTPDKPYQHDAIVVLRVEDLGNKALANLTPLAALSLARNLTQVAEHILAKESR